MNGRGCKSHLKEKGKTLWQKTQKREPGKLPNKLKERAMIVGKQVQWKLNPLNGRKA